MRAIIVATHAVDWRRPGTQELAQLGRGLVVLCSSISLLVEAEADNIDARPPIAWLRKQARRVNERVRNLRARKDAGHVRALRTLQANPLSHGIDEIRRSCPCEMVCRATSARYALTRFKKLHSRTAP